MNYTDHGKYAQIRCAHPPAVGRSGNAGVANLVEAGPGRTLVLSSKGPYFTFRIVETGVEIPLSNVTSAVPVGAPTGASRRRVNGDGTVAERRAERLAKAEKRNEEALLRAEEEARAKRAALAERAKRKNKRAAPVEVEPEEENLGD